MSEQAANHQNVLQMQCFAAAKESEEKRIRNREILLKLIRSVYFLAKNHIPHTTTYGNLVELLIANGDELLKHHTEEGGRNAQYTSSFSATNIIEAIDFWIERNLENSLNSSSYFTIMADECADVSSHEELSICCRWVVDGQPEETS